MHSIIVPAYNEEKTLKGVVEGIKKAVEGLDCEIIVVDDGSVDRTAEIAASVPGLKLVRHVANKGYGAALKTGAQSANGEWVIYIDADGQHYPQDIRKLISRMPGADMVVGQRTQHMSLLRAPAKIFLAWMANYLAERKIPDLNSGFRAIRRDLVLKYSNILPNTFSFTTTITLALFKGGYSIVYEPIRIRRRAGGTSMISPLRDTPRFAILLLRMTMLFSPLRVFLPISAGLFLLGAAVFLYEAIVYFNLGTLSVILFISALLVFCFGLLADQVSQLRRSQ